MKLSYTEQAQKVLQIAQKASQKYKHTYIGTEHLLLGLLTVEDGTASMVLKDAQVEEEKLLELIDKLIAPPKDEIVRLEERREFTPRTRKLLERSQSEAKSFQSDLIGTEHILIAMLKESDCVGTRLLYTMGVNIQKLYMQLLTAMGEEKRFSKEDLKSGKALQTAISSATPMLDQYSRDLTKMALDGRLDPVVGREEQIQRLIQILSRRTKNNPCLIGEPGVGKTAIVEGLAQRICLGVVPDSVKNMRVVMLDLSGMVAGSKYRGEFEERIKRVLHEVANNKGILLFIDELHTIIGAGGAEGALDASNILKPSLSRGEIQIVGATTITEYRKYIEKDAALERRFQPVMVEEPTREESIQILQGLRSHYEKHHGVKITEEALEAAVDLSIRYIHDRFLPDKAIDVMDEAASKVRIGGFGVPDSILMTRKEIQDLIKEKESALVGKDLQRAGMLQDEQEEKQKYLDLAVKRFEKRQQSKQLEVSEDSIAEIISGWTKIPVQKLEETESKRLVRLEKVLHKRVVGQEEAVLAVAKAVKRGRVGLKDPSRPIGSFLFLGPTGVGKTELSKALAEAIFGDEQAMIRIDMSEYMEKHSVSKIIGSPPGYVGYDEGGQLSEKVRRNPYSVILFDEIEKAHPDVFNILLQVLDDGHITDAQGRKIDFKQTIIIMTSNAGAQTIIEPKKLGFVSVENKQKDYNDMKNGVMEEVRRIFKPEFLNRIDEIIVFHTLTRPEIKQIVGLLLLNLKKRCKEQMNLELTVRDSVKEYIAETGFDSKYGARPLKRKIQNKIEDAMAEEILEGKIKQGDHVTISVSKKDIKFSVTH